MQFDFAELSSFEVYRWLVFGVMLWSIVWVSTCSADGVVNLVPFSFF